MGVAGYFPGGLPDFRRELKKAAEEVSQKGDTAVEPLSLAENQDRYDFVEEYDPVLRAHCRLGLHGNRKF